MNALDTAMGELQLLLREDLARHLSEPTATESEIIGIVAAAAARVAPYYRRPLTAVTAARWRRAAEVLSEGITALGESRIDGSHVARYYAEAVRITKTAPVPKGRARKGRRPARKARR